MKKKAEGFTSLDDFDNSPLFDAIKIFLVHLSQS